MKGSIELMRIIAVILITFTHTRHNIESGYFYFLFEKIPTYGTPVLSLISGYLFWNKTRYKHNIFNTKVASLLIPYLIANTLVLVPVLIANYLGFNYLNRLDYNYTLITEGILSLNSPPINPPTYFIRDIFILFVMLELFLKRNFKMLLIIIPILLFGKIFLRWDIVVMFLFGSLIANFEKHLKLSIAIQIFFGAFMYFKFPELLRFSIAGLIFSFLITIPISMPKTGGFSYLLHLYHSPVIVFLFPIISIFTVEQITSVFIQVFVSIVLIGIFYVVTIKNNRLRILTGNRH
ncbi:hypothetical protein KDU71_16035 [Carboxylicivirga sediminis]|uniref:Acyltransferase 3 domain-containing protein n=1 Tax=Carboxylicivirga sediminis TaxID=2006564 RepID=A0A941F6V5_9BACT|nr:acyltransferase family protein [Carboxylicivirga sediminis]MBR8537083.1 hypothetical protein [Carboxylicivirga sediminis]